MCHGDLRQHCSQEIVSAGLDGEHSDGAVIECLRRKVALNGIKNDSCIVEVLRLSLAAKADVNVDPVLARDCASSLEALCGKVGHILSYSFLLTVHWSWEPIK